MSMPHGVQRKRVKGWRLPPNTVCVTRGTRFGNPFRVDPDEAAAAAVVPATLLDVKGLYACRDAAQACKWFEASIGFGAMPTRKEIREKLRGKNLACYCPLGQPCHRDILLKIANE